MLIGAVIWGAAAAQPPPAAEHQLIQAQVWSETPRWRSFGAFHALFLAIFCTGGGLIALARLAPIGRSALLVGILAMLGYFTLEPRATPAELPLVIQLLTVAVLGLLTPRFLPRSWQLPGVAAWLPLLLPSAALIGLTQLSRHSGLIAPVSATVTQELLLSAIYSLSGALVGEAQWGSARPLFVAETLPLSGGRRLRQTVQALLLVSFLCALVSFLVIDRSQPTMREWVLMAPLIPAFMAFYAPYKWLFADTPAAVFGADGGPPNVQQMQFFVGVMFEYLTVATLVAIFQALKHPASNVRLVTAIFFIVLYWAPSIWLLMTMNSLG